MRAGPIHDAIDERAEDLVGLAAELIRFDTTVRASADEPAREEAALQELLAARLDRTGFTVELWEPDPGFLDAWSQQVSQGLGFGGRPQLIARWRGGDGPTLLLCGHIDVAPAGPRERWTSDPFSPVIRDGALYGRGACDMKGGVAALVVAAEVLAELATEPAGGLVVVTVTDEEWNGAGVLAVAARGVTADAGIVPEPTGFQVWIAYRDALSQAAVGGRPGHAEMPRPAITLDHPIVSAALSAGAAVGRPGKVGEQQCPHDAVILTRFPAPTIGYGPSGASAEGGSIAHAVDEHVPVAELVDCAKALALAALRFWEGDMTAEGLLARRQDGFHARSGPAELGETKEAP